VPPLVRRSYPLGGLLLLSCHPDPPQDGEGPRGCNKCFTPFERADCNCEVWKPGLVRCAACVTARRASPARD